MSYIVEYENGLKRIVHNSGLEPRAASAANNYPQEGMRSYAYIPDKWDTSEDLTVRKDGLYENAHLVVYSDNVNSSTEKPNV